MKTIFRISFMLMVFMIMWQIIVTLFHFPPYILPGPLMVLKAGWNNSALLCQELLTTMSETLLGLFIGTLIGCSGALIMIFFQRSTRWILPILLVSQALPTFAIAPLLVIWFGFGMTSKIATTVIMLFFPITTAFHDGLRQTNSGWLELATTMNAQKWRTFWYIRIPAALPSLASGLRVATAIAPIGAIIGEWVGASKGLGFLMLNANERMQIDLMFAALFLLILFSLTLYSVVNRLIRAVIPWHLEHSS